MPTPTPKPTVLYVFPQGKLGGMEQAMIPLVTGHQRYRAEAILLNPGPLEQAFAAEQVPVTVLQGGVKMRNLRQAIRAVRRCKGLLAENSVDIVATAMAWAHLIGGSAAKQTRTPLCLHQHGPIGGRFEFLAKWIRPDGVVCNSEQTQRSHERIWGKARHQAVIRPPVRRFDGCPPIAKLDGRPDHWCGMLGRISPEKGIPFVMEAIAPVLKNHPDWGLLIVGENWTGGNSLNGLATRLGISRQLWLTGYQQDVAGYLNLCDLVISGSLSPEGFGLSIAEAMAAGKAVLAPNEGGYQEFVQSETDGVLYNPRDSADLQKQCERLLRAPEKRASLGIAAQKTAAALFSTEAVIKQTETFYDTLREISR